VSGAQMSRFDRFESRALRTRAATSWAVGEVDRLAGGPPIALPPGAEGVAVEVAEASEASEVAEVGVAKVQAVQVEVEAAFVYETAV